MAEIFGVVAGVFGIMSAFQTAHLSFKDWRRKRKEKKEEKERARAEAESALQAASPAVRRGFNDGCRSFGIRFRKGDDISTESLTHILTKFTRSMKQMIQAVNSSNPALDLSLFMSATSNARNVPTKFVPLFDIHCYWRSDTLSTLHQLGQRLHVLAPIPRPFRRVDKKVPKGKKRVDQVDESMAFDETANESLEDHLKYQHSTPDELYDSSASAANVPMVRNHTVVELSRRFQEIAKHSSSGMRVPSGREPSVAPSNTLISLEEKLAALDLRYQY
ncbi:hypothetical protein FQN57_000162 [Myotisia sp. PD_48]|nr:hypothetical protein FQN57_000162 [Myotisia sp. PD_48]